MGKRVGRYLRAVFGLAAWVLEANGQNPTPSNVTMWHNDLARTGVNPNETALTPANVNTNTFGLLFNLPTDGFLYAQPLFLAGVTIPGQGVHNVVFAATEHDTVYAFDADDGAAGVPLWKADLKLQQSGLSSTPISDYGLADPPAFEFGITGTPVIDTVTSTMYVVGQFKQAAPGGTVYKHMLFALDVGTGAQKFGGPVTIKASVAGSGSGSVDGVLNFQSFLEYQRSGLVLVNGVVYVCFSSVGDLGSYHGWVIGYDATTLKQVSAWVDTPNASQGGIWMTGAAPAVDSGGDMYLTTGNGTFTGSAGGVDFGDTLVRLHPSAGKLALADYFTPSDQALMATIDGDFGSAGVIVLPDSAGGGNHPHLAVACGKDGIICLVDRDNLGHFTPSGNTHAVQTFQNQNSCFTSPAFFNGTLYYSTVRDVVYAFSVAGGSMSSGSVANTFENLGYPGAVPCISANGTSDAVLWVVQTSGFSASQPAVLRAYDPNDLTTELYDSSSAGARDLPGIGMKFSTPIITNGKVYVGTGAGISVFGLFPAPNLAATGPGSIELSGRPGVTYTVQVATSLGAGPGTWRQLSVVTLAGSTQTVTDPGATPGEDRYYRALVGTQ
jgi:hypothetical protein